MPDPTGITTQGATSPQPAPNQGQTGPTCPACGSSTTVDHNGFDICDNSGVPKEHCQLSAQDVNQT